MKTLFLVVLCQFANNLAFFNIKKRSGKLFSRLVYGFFLILCLTASSNAATLIVTKTADTNDGVCDADCSLREAVVVANAAVMDDMITFDPAVFMSAQVIVLTNGELIFDNAGKLVVNGPGANLLTLSGNNASRVFTNNGADAIVRGLTVSGGNGQGNNPGMGGGIFSPFGGILTLENVTVRNNVANQGGGIFHTQNSPVILRNCDLYNNQSPFGGTAITSRSELTVENSHIAGNGVVGQGSPAVLIVNTIAEFTNSTIENNIGGGFNVEGSTLDLRQSSVFGNTTEFAGGGIRLGSAQTVVNIVNSTISGNTTEGYGGGIYLFSPSSTVNLVHSTITQNTANIDGNGTGYGGGLNNAFGGTVNSFNSIIADNIDRSGNAPDFAGTIISQGHNLIRRTFGLTISGNTTGNILDQDPKLLPLGDYGGPTKTHAFQPGSPAIDAADPGNFLATDQRGVSRPQNGDQNGTTLPDIGSFENSLIIYEVTKATDSDDGMCDADCSLREAIRVAAANSSLSETKIVFSPSSFAVPQTIDLSLGEIRISRPGIISIDGPGADLLTVSGSNTSRVFFIAAGTTLTIRGVTVSRGNGSGSLPSSGGGIFIDGATVIITESVVSANTASFAGGGIYNNFGRFYIVSSRVANNRAVNAGGGVRNDLNSITNIVNSIFEGNTSGLGGGFQNFGGTLAISGSTFRGNSANSGGGVQNLDNGRLDIQNSTFTGNTASVEGGGIHSIGYLSIMSSGITGNTVGMTGRGGGISVESSAFLNKVKILNNKAGAAGGGIYNAAETTIDFATFADNSSDGDGGGIFNTALLTIRSSSVYRNSAIQNGGGMSTSGPLTFATSTLSGNTAGSAGGGFFSMSTGYSYVIGSTVVNNRANTGGGVRNSLNLVARNSIFANNRQTDGTDSDFLGVMTSQGYNLIKNASGTTITQNMTGIITGLDPNLGPLKNNGGITFTHGLRAGSPALDAASTSQVDLYDQRGFSRSVDGNGDGFARVDIGSFERRNYDNVETSLFDYDGDGRADLSVRRPSDNIWYLLRGTAGYTAMEFGVAGDLVAPADYDGDGRTDVAVFRPSNGTWYIFNSASQSFQTFSWGANGDLPVPADHDGDGKADLVVFRPSTNTWYTRFANGTFSTTVFGVAGDKPVVGDFDGDGKADIALFRPSDNNWYILKTGVGFFIQTWGEAGDIPVPADYDGDGKTDVAVFRPSTGQWFRIRSTAGFDVVNWGANGDKPIPADYDGDGKSDVAVFRPSNATWYIVGSTSGQLIQTYGAAGDVPTEGAFIY